MNPTTEPLFLIEDIHYRHGVNDPVLRGADFQLHAGEKVALVGSNGAGKTTLLHLMVGLLKPDRGQIIAFGKVRRREKEFLEVRARAGMLFQDADDQLFCPTVREDIAFGPLNLGKNAEEAEVLVNNTLERLDMAAYADRITHRLSGGEKRMIALATVLAMDPDVLLLDEPTNALDWKAEARLLEILHTLPQAMVIISHQQNFLEQIATRYVLLKRGWLSPVN